MDTNSAALGFYAARGFLLVARLQSYYQQQKLQQELQERQLISEASTGTSETQTIGQQSVGNAGVDLSLSSTLTAEREMSGNSPQAINNARSQFQPLQNSGVSVPKGDALLLTLTLQPPAPPVVESKAGMTDLATAAKSFVDWLTRAGDPSNASQNLSLIPEIASAAVHSGTHNNDVRSHITVHPDSLQQQTLACAPSSGSAVLPTCIPSARTSKCGKHPQDSSESLTAPTSMTGSWTILHSLPLLPACFLLLRIVSQILHTLVAVTAGLWQEATYNCQLPSPGQLPAGHNSNRKISTRSSHATCANASSITGRSVSAQMSQSRQAGATVLYCHRSAHWLPASSPHRPGQAHVRQTHVPRVSWC